MTRERDIDKILGELDIDDLCGQLLCYEISSKDCPEELDKLFQKIRPGGIFVSGMTPQQVAVYTEIANKYTKVPVIVAADVENGPGCVIPGETIFPHQMAFGACDDTKLIELVAEETAKITRKSGIHWTLSPVVDLNINPNNPVINIRAISDSEKQTAKIGGALVRGLQKNGYLVCSCKHFPGDGTDDRNQHFCTAINELSLSEWMGTFGYVYQSMIDQGTASIMAGHIALPAYDEEKDEILGYKPCTLSYRLITQLLKGELGFSGCVVSDALSMIGACAMTDLEKLPIEFLLAGGDMILFPEDGDFDLIKQAVLTKEISQERLLDAVKRILVMKEKARLFEDQQQLQAEITCGDTEALAEKIGEKSIKIIRNSKNLLPLSLEKGAKILIVNLQKKEEGQRVYVSGLDELDKELQRRGFYTLVLYNPGHKKIREIAGEFDCILINCKMSSLDYPGGSLRAGWDQFMTFWRGYILKHPKVIFTSFGDPYKLYEFPFLHTYINAFSYSAGTQKGFVKVLLGEIEPIAKNPISFSGFFEREVE